MTAPVADACARGWRLLLAWSVGCVALAGPVEASPGDADDPVLLPPWVIAEHVDRPLQPAREDSFASTLGPTSVVASSSWSGRSIATLAEALRRAPGVMLQESFGGFEPPRLSLRGSGLDSAPTARGIALLTDGLPLARADGSFHSGLFDPLLFSRVEIYRGTMHMALTPAVLGGVLHAVSRPADGPAGPTLRFAADDRGAARATITHDSPTARFAGSWARAPGWRDHSAQDRRAVNAGLRRMIDATTQLEFSAYAATAGYEVPGPLTLAEAWLRPRTVSAAVLRDRPRRDATIVRASAQLKSAGPISNFAAGLAMQRLHDDFRQLQGNGETDSRSDDLAAHATLSRRVALGGVDHQLLGRVTGSIGRNYIDRFLNDQARRGARFAALDARAGIGAVSVEDIVWLRPALAVGAGATAVHTARRFDDRGDPAGPSRTFQGDDFSPRAGVTWAPVGNVSFHAALSSGIEPPSYDDLMAVAGPWPNLTLRTQALRPQRATTLEFGSRGTAGRLGWNITVYRSAWRDEILRLADAAGQPRGATNAGPTLHEGIETALHWSISGPPHRFSFHATSTLGRFRFASDPVYGNNRIAGAPPHTGSAELVYERARGFFAAVESTWTAGRTPVDHAGRLTFGGHALLHARAGWRRDRHLAIFLSARNLLDRTHVASTAGVLDIARTPATTAIFLPGAGRGFSIGVEWQR